MLAACHLVQWTEDVSRHYLVGARAARAREPWSTQEEETEWNVIFPVVFPNWQISLTTNNLLLFKEISALNSEQIPLYIRGCCLFCTCNLHLKWPWCALGNKPSNKHVAGWFCELACTAINQCAVGYFVLREYTYNLHFNAYKLSHWRRWNHLFQVLNFYVLNLQRRTLPLVPGKLCGKNHWWHL